MNIYQIFESGDDSRRGLRVQRLRMHRGLSQDELAARLGVSQGAVSKIEKGGDSKHLISLAKVLNCDVDWLSYGKGTSPFDVSQPKTITRAAPQLTWEQAALISTGVLQMDNIVTKTQHPISPLIENSGRCYALEIENDSMVSDVAGQKSFPKGSTIIVDPAREPQSGNYVIALEQGATEVIFKQYIVDGLKKILRPLNRQYSVIEITDKIKICGVVIQHSDITV